MVVLDAVNKQARYSLYISRLKASKSEANQVNSRQKSKSKVQMMFSDVTMQKATYAWRL